MNFCLRNICRAPFVDYVCRTLSEKQINSLGSLTCAKFVRNYASYLGAKVYNPDEKIEFEVSKNPEEWKYVERLLPYKFIPEPKTKDFYPSGWSLPKLSDIENLPYFLRRSKNHMIPVYLKLSHRGMRKLTVIRHIKGDVWLFEKDLKGYLEKKLQKEIATRIDEVSGKVTIKGDHVHNVLVWVKDKGF